MRIVFVYEHLFAPFDEGIKILAHQIHQHYESEHDVTLVRNIMLLPNAINSLLMVPHLLLVLLLRRPQKLVFIPQAALTFSSLIKLAILHLFYDKKLVAVGVQQRQFKPWQTALLGRLSFPTTYVLSKAMATPLKAINLHAEVLNVGIDRLKYQPAASREALRKQFGIPNDRRVLLHVGHIRKSRNIHWLLEIKAALPDLEIVMVGSTATEQDMKLFEELDNADIRVFRDYLPHIEQIYQTADIYCFPVTLDTAAMETPLSVLEAMSTNLPIISTRFGRLPEQFADSECFRYVDCPEDIISLLKTDFGQSCNNREKTMDYSWSATAEKLLS